MLGLVTLLIFAAWALGGYAFAARARARNEKKETLTRRVETVAGAGAETLASSVLKDQRLSRIGFLNALLGRVSLATRLVRMIRQAGLKRRVGEVLLYVPLLAFIGFMLVLLLGGSPLVALPVAAMAGSIPLIVIQRLRRKRALRFAEQLPDALDLVRAALQAGHAFVSALGVVADEFPDPVAEEFRRVAEEIRLGLPMRDALYDLAERVADENIPFLVVGVLVAQNVGGNLAEVVDNIGYTIRERFKLLRDMRVLSAQARLSGTVLTALPFLVALVMCVVNPEYFMPMLQSPTGRYMIGYALMSILWGHVVIRYLVKIRV